MPLFSDILKSYTLFRENHSGGVQSGPRLFDASGAEVCNIERLTVTGQNTRFEGWADAERVTVYHEAGQELAFAVPHIARPDVQMARASAHDRFGFTLGAPEPPRRLKLTVTRSGVETPVGLMPASLGARIKEELRLNRRYFGVLAKAMPDIWAWLRHRDEEARLRAGRIFRAAGASLPVLNIAALSAEGWQPAPASAITIVVPVYQGLHLIDPVISRVRDNTDLPWHLVVVNDASPDPQVQARLEHWRDVLTDKRMTLIAAPQNLGFVGAANLGLAAAIERGVDVVLLNSDALVPPGWASRLMHPMRAGTMVASVTPFSNDAEIANVPLMGTPIALEPTEADAIDAAAAQLHGPAAIAEVPTGVGFCMAMNLDLLRVNPQLDTIFGRGYGEEVDWCQKAVALGWRNLLNAGLFVEHQGGQSFGSDAKLQLIRQNGTIISQRYPQFDQQVQDFIGADPLCAQRLLLGITFASLRAKGRGHKLGVFLGHGLGGGAEIYLAERLKAELDKTGFAVVIRTMPNGTWQLELHSELGITAGTTEDIAALLPIFRDAAGLHIVYSCGVGATHPLDIPAALIQLADTPDSSLEVTFNDFYPLSPSYTLLNSAGAFQMPPLDPADPAHLFAGPDGREIPLEDWTRGWGALIARAGQLTTFSHSTAGILGAAWPDARDRITVRPHHLPQPVPAIAAPTGGDVPVIGVLGNISQPKGAAVLTELAKELARTGQGRLVLIGNLEPGFQLAKPSLATGSYQLRQLAQIVETQGISRWFFPSIWPETFSYVVHEMIATGLPVWSFDIGAQADAVRQAVQAGHKGGLLSLESGRYDVQAIAKTLTAV